MRIAPCAVVLVAAMAGASCEDRSVVSGVDAGVYQTVLVMAGGPAIVEQLPLAWPVIGQADPAWLTEYGAVPEPLRLAAAQLAVPLEPFHEGAWPTGTRVIPVDQIQASGAASWHAFSRVLRTASSTDALVYHEHRGAMAGPGRFVWLQRESASSPWVVRAIIARRAS